MLFVTMPGLILLSPVMPLWAIAGCALLFGWAAWRSSAGCRLRRRDRLLLWGLRMLSFAVLAFLLLLPFRREVRREQEKPALAVICDLSASMTDNPGRERLTRADKSVAFLKSAELRRALERYRVFVFGAGATCREELQLSALPAPNEGRTYLVPVLNRAAERLRGENLAAIILLSDGLDQSLEKLSDRAAQTPIFIPALEESGTAAATQPDFWIQEIDYPRRATQHWEVSLTVGIRRKNGQAGQTFPLQLLGGGVVLKEVEVVFAEQETYRSVTLTLPLPELGSQLLQAVILPEEDATADNNRRDFVIEVTDSKRRILYLEGTPRWEFKYLKRALTTERSQELAAFLQSGTGAFINFDERGGSERGTPPDFSETGLREFSLIILGDLAENGVNKAAAEALVQYVEKGGALLFMGGTRAYGSGGVFHHPQLQPLTPVVSAPGATMREGRFTVDFTASGRALPAFSGLGDSGRLPPLLSVWEPVQLGEFATTVLAASDGAPVLVGSRCGQGRVAVVLSDSFWRWQLGAESGGREKGMYANFIGQLLLWLAPTSADHHAEGTIRLVPVTRDLFVQERVQLGAVCGRQVPLAGLTCRVTQPDGTVVALPLVSGDPGREGGLSPGEIGVRCDFMPEQSGVYRLEAAARDGTRSETMLLPVRKPELEFTGALLNREWLQHLAKNSGGHFFALSESKKALSELPGRERLIESVREEPLWNRWWWLAILIALFTLEWYLRRRHDLV